MADQQHTQQEERRQQAQQQGQSDPQYTTPTFDLHSQQAIDSLFSQQMDPGGIEGWQAYAELVQQNVNTLRRITEIQALRLAKQGVVSAVVQQLQTSPQVTHFLAMQVAAQLQTNPQLIKPAVQQAMSIIR